MRLLMFLGQVMRDVRSQKLRTFLTVFGIIWGTTAILLLLAFGESLHRKMGDSARALGERIVICWPSRTSMAYEGLNLGRPILVRPEDILAMRGEIPDLQYLSPEFTRWQATVKYGDKVVLKRVHGVAPDFGPMRYLTPQWGGRFVDRVDVENKRRVVFIGDELKKEIFGDKEAVSEYLQVDGVPFLVIGVLKHKEQDSSYSGMDDDKLFIPWTTFSSLYGDVYVDDFVLRPRDGVESARVMDRVYEFFARRLRFDPQDREAIQTWDTREMEAMFNALFYGMRIFLGIVGSFTLIVGGIGVANIMNIVIEERTREIGIKMALGAKRRFILLQFIGETFTLTAVGGVIGFLLSWGIVTVFPSFHLEEYVGTPRVSASVGLAAAVLLLGVGLLSGLPPARRAASLQPVQALKP